LLQLLVLLRLPPLLRLLLLLLLLDCRISGHSLCSGATLVLASRLAFQDASAAEMALLTGGFCVNCDRRSKGCLWPLRYEA